MKIYRHAIILILILQLTSFLNCKLSCKSVLPNHSPLIKSISGPDAARVGDTVTLICDASDQDGDQLDYNWTCTSGTLLSSTGKKVNWLAPDASGTATVTVNVRDGRGGVDTRSKTISINRVTTTVIDWDGQIRARSSKHWTEYFPAGYTVSGNFWVDNYDINFLILDAANYENWRNNQSYQYVVKVSRSPGSSFTGTIHTSGDYYIILDNTFSIFTDKYAHLFLQKTSP